MNLLPAAAGRTQTERYWKDTAWLIRARSRTADSSPLVA
jgi:hypothetical protein